MLCNAGLAKSVCDAAYRDNCLYKITWATEDRYVELLRAYHLIRYTLLACDHPELRPFVTSEYLACTEEMHNGNFWLRQFLSSTVPPRLTFSMGLYEHNVHRWRDPRGDNEWPIYPTRLVDKWRTTAAVLPTMRDFHMCEVVEICTKTNISIRPSARWIATEKVIADAAGGERPLDFDHGESQWVDEWYTY